MYIYINVIHDDIQSFIQCNAFSCLQMAPHSAWLDVFFL